MNNVDDIFLPSGHLSPDILDEATIRVLREASAQTRSTNWDSVRTPHLFMGLLAAPDSGVFKWASRSERISPACSISSATSSCKTMPSNSRRFCSTANSCPTMSFGYCAMPASRGRLRPRPGQPDGFADHAVHDSE